MSPEDKKFNSPKLSIVSKRETMLKQPKEEISEIPLSLFVALRNADGLIQDVTFSSEIRQAINRVKSLESSDLEYLREEIKRMTGFSIESLNTKREDLEREYRWKKKAPFSTETKDNF